ncbi:hypothetical protein ACV35P_34475, partial [Pseudomonas aeruginosa]
FSEMPNPAGRPGYSSGMPRTVAEYGQARAEWMMHRLRNLNLYPSLLVIDQISSQLRIVRPRAWNRTEIVSQCIGVRLALDADALADDLGTVPGQRADDAQLRADLVDDEQAGVE